MLLLLLLLLRLLFLFLMIIVMMMMMMAAVISIIIIFIINTIGVAVVVAIFISFLMFVLQTSIFTWLSRLALWRKLWWGNKHFYSLSYLKESQQLNHRETQVQF